MRAAFFRPALRLAQNFQQAAGDLLVAAPTGGDQGFAERTEKEGAIRRQVGQRFFGETLRFLKPAAPAAGLGRHQAQATAHGGVFHQREATFGVAQRGRDVAAFEITFGGGRKIEGGLLRLIAAIEMFGEHLGGGFARFFQPDADLAVADPAIVERQQGIGRFAEKGVPEGIFGIGREAAGPAAFDQLELLQPGQGLEGDSLTGSGFDAPAEQRGDTPLPKGLPENARRPQDPPQLGFEAFKTHLNHGQHGFRQRFRATVGARAGQLFEEKGIARRMFDQTIDFAGGGRRTQPGLDQLGGRPSSERAQWHGGERAPGPQIGETFEGFRSPGGEHAEGLPAELVERGIEGLDARQIAPVEILEHQEKGLLARFGGEQVEPGAAQLIAHQLGIAAGGAQGGRFAVFVGGGPDQLAEEKCDPVAGGVVEMPRQTHPQLEVAQGRRLVVAQGRGMAESGGEQAEGGGGRERVGAAEPDFGVVLLVFEKSHQLGEQSRFAAAGRRGDQQGPRFGVEEHVFGQALQERHFPLATDKRGKRAEHRPQARKPGVLFAQGQAVFVAAENETGVEQTGGDFVETHEAGIVAGNAQQAGGAIDDVADRQASGHRGATGGEGGGHRAGDAVQGEGTAGGEHGAVGGHAGTADGDHYGTVGEGLDVAAEGGGLGDQLFDLDVQRQAIVGRLDRSGRFAAGGGFAYQRDRRQKHDAHQLMFELETAAAARGFARGGAGGLLGGHGGRLEPQAAQSLLDLARVFRPGGAVFGEQIGDQGIELGAGTVQQLAQLGCRLPEDFRQHRHRVGALEARPAGQAFEKHTAEGKKVGPAVDVGFAARLFGGHIGGCAEQFAGEGEEGAVAAGDAEVDQAALGRIAADEENIAGFDVAVHDAEAVQVAEGAGHPFGQQQGITKFEGALIEAGGEVETFEPLGGKVVQAVVGTGIDVADEGGMVEGGEDFGFAHETFDVGPAGVQNLERHRTPLRVEAIDGPVDVAHATLAGQVFDLEAVGYEQSFKHWGKIIISIRWGIPAAGVTFCPWRSNRGSATTSGETPMKDPDFGKMLSLPCLVVVVSLVWSPLPVNAATVPRVEAPPAKAEGYSAAGFLYAQAILTNGKTYEGRLRFDDEEAFWGDYFNSNKEYQRFLRDAPNQGNERHPVKVLGIPLFNHNETWGRQFVVRFGDLERIEVSGGGSASVFLKGGMELEIDGGSNDLRGEIVVWDKTEGETRIDWRKLRTLRFLPTPPGLEVKERRFYGRLKTTTGLFEGYIQWDQEECLSTDVLSGESKGKDRDVQVGELKAIERDGNRSRFFFRDGHEEVLGGTNDVDDSNRGIWVEDARFGRVLVDWDAFVRLDVVDLPHSGPAYGDYAPTRTLEGKVHLRGGKVHEGQIIYDLDEAFGWEMLDGDDGDLAYSIPFEKIATIRPNGEDGSEITLKNGQKLLLEDSQDVDETNAGLLVGPEVGKRIFLEWKDVELIELR